MSNTLRISEGITWHGASLKMLSECEIIKRPCPRPGFEPGKTPPPTTPPPGTTGEPCKVIFNSTIPKSTVSKEGSVQVSMSFKCIKEETKEGETGGGGGSCSSPQEGNQAKVVRYSTCPGEEEDGTGIGSVATNKDGPCTKICLGTKAGEKKGPILLEPKGGGGDGEEGDGDNNCCKVLLEDDCIISAE